MKRHDTSLPHAHPAPPLSPLGALFQREAARLAERYPEWSARQHAETILRQFAHIFLDVTVEELERAMREGSAAFSDPTDVGAQAIVGQMVAQAIATTKQRQADRPPGAARRSW